MMTTAFRTLLSYIPIKCLTPMIEIYSELLLSAVLYILKEIEKICFGDADKQILVYRSQSLSNFK